MSTSEVSTNVKSAAETIAELRAKQEVAKYGSKEVQAAVTQGANYLPFLQLASGETNIFKKGLVPANHFAIKKGDNYVDLGESLVAMICQWRSKAMYFSPDILSYYDPESAEFKAIKAKQEAEKDPGCGWGPDLLLWLPEANEVVTYFLSSPTGRISSTDMLAIFDDGTGVMTLGSKSVEGKYGEAKGKFWRAPTAEEYDMDIAMPDMEKLNKELEKFSNPTASNVEIVPEGETNERE